MTTVNNSLEDQIQEVLVSIKKDANNKLKNILKFIIELSLESKFDSLSLYGKDDTDVSLKQLLENDEEKRIAIIGQPGAGKSTLALHTLLWLVDNYSKTGKLPVYCEGATLRSEYSEADDSKRILNFIKNHSVYKRFAVVDIEELAKQGRFILIFDALNEIQVCSIESFVDDIKSFNQAYDKVTIIVTCRTLEFPASVEDYFDGVYSIKAITEEQIERQFIDVLGQSDGSIYYNEICYGKQNRLLELCRNPLILSMVLAILLKKTGETDEESRYSLNDLSTKGDIYTHFYWSIKNFRNKKYVEQNRYDSKILLEELRSHEGQLLEAIGFYMQYKQSIYIKKTSALELIREYPYKKDIDKGTVGIDNLKKAIPNEWAWYLLKGVISSGFFDVGNTTYNDMPEIDQSIEYIIGNENAVKFIHQSFQEYFAGKYINSRITGKEKDDKEFLKNLFESLFKNADDISSNMCVFANNKSNVFRHGETIEFASLLDEHNNVISKTLIEYAMQYEDSDALIVLVRCILGNYKARQDSNLIADACISLLDAFKYWEIPFKYDLIYGAQDLIEAETNTDRIPDRIRSDIEYFSNKYRSGEKVYGLSENMSFKQLEELCDKCDNENKTLNALYTLGIREWRRDRDILKVLDLMFDCLSSDKMSIKEQSIKSIKRILEAQDKKGAKLSHYFTEERIVTLLDVIKSESSSPNLKSYTLNLLALVDDDNVMNALKDYLKDKNNPYRDSASWSLQSLAMRIQKRMDVDFLDDLCQFYYECLISETNDLTGFYSKGNLVYTLSQFHATKYLPKLIDWLHQESEPYVLEDGINAIGVLAKDLKDNDEYKISAQKCILEYILPSESEYYKKSAIYRDPVIKAKAVKTLNEMKALDSTLIDKEQFVDDYSIVRLALAEDKHVHTKTTIQQLMGLDEKRNNTQASEGIVQYFKNVREVTNKVSGHEE